MFGAIDLWGLASSDPMSLINKISTKVHNLIKEKLKDLIEQHFNRKGSLYLACNENCAFSHISNQ